MAKLGYVSQFGEILAQKNLTEPGSKNAPKFKFLKKLFNLNLLIKKYSLKKKTDVHLHVFVARMRKFAPLKITTIIIKIKNRKSIGSLLGTFVVVQFCLALSWK
jgi:hypothetical protein